MKDLKGKFVQVIYSSQHRIVLKLDNKRIILTPEIDDHSYDDVSAYLDYEVDQWQEKWETPLATLDVMEHFSARYPE